jgi:Flp pilus assembly protein TadD
MRFCSEAAVRKGDFEKAVDSLMKAERPAVEAGRHDLAANYLDLAVNYLMQLRRFDEAAEVADAASQHAKQCSSPISNVLEAKASHLRNLYKQPVYSVSDEGHT